VSIRPPRRNQMKAGGWKMSYVWLISMENQQELYLENLVFGKETVKF
jgi:hypothetical protein